MLPDPPRVEMRKPASPQTRFRCDSTASALYGRKQGLDWVARELLASRKTQ